VKSFIGLAPGSGPRSYLNIVGEFNWLIFAVLLHDKLHDRSLSVDRMHRKFHPDRVSVRIDPGVWRNLSGSAEAAAKHPGLFRGVLKFKHHPYSETTITL
jgi:hypothetical protein